MIRSDPHHAHGCSSHPTNGARSCTCIYFNTYSSSRCSSTCISSPFTLTAITLLPFGVFHFPPWWCGCAGLITAQVCWPDYFSERRTNRVGVTRKRFHEVHAHAHDCSRKTPGKLARRRRMAGEQQRRGRKRPGDLRHEQRPVAAHVESAKKTAGNGKGREVGAVHAPV